MPLVSPTGLYELTARSARRDLWLAPRFDDPDYRTVDTITAGRAEELRFVPAFHRVGSGTRAGDLLWVTGAPFQIASAQFIQTLTNIRATGFAAYPIQLEKLPTPLPGYQGLAITAFNADADVFNAYGDPSISFTVNQRVFEALTAAGALDVDVTPFTATSP